MRTTFKKTTQSQHGFATLMAVLIVGAIGAAVGIGFLTRGIEASKNTVTILNAFQARQLADQCAEIALQVIRDSSTFSGTGTSSNDRGACTYNIINLGGNRRNIETTGVATGISKKILVEIDGINPQILILSWREVL